jgi:hypothetical protein
VDGSNSVKKLADIFTSLLKRAVDMLFVLNPKGTSVGAFLGIVLDGVLAFFSPALKRLSSYDITAVRTYHLIAAGVLLLNIPILFRRRELPQEVENALEAIRRAKPHMTKVQIRMQYLALLNDVLERVADASSNTPRRKQA